MPNGVNRLAKRERREGSMLTGLIIRPIMGKKTSILSKLEIAKKKKKKKQDKNRQGAD